MNKLSLQIREHRAFGLQTFKVYVNGVSAREFMSLNGALAYVKRTFPEIKLSA